MNKFFHGILLAAILCSLFSLSGVKDYLSFSEKWFLFGTIFLITQFSLNWDWENK